MKPQMPMGIELHRDDRGVMGPVLEQRLVALIEAFEIVGAIRGPPGKQDHVMGAGDRVDAVQLHKTQPVDQIQQVSPFGPTRRLFGQRMTVHEQRTGHLVV